ncbi:hypothetical protein [Phyllobacterium sp. YR531]|uniref:hypothetical protein n=1 Tax=Phyllobacterium sp. YR531 TaxID=1144343 RepID=UPI00026F644D|nr:hypothetical protein [Phyllobacterium sp. YR531]EJN02555.1 hypothetical protein PMI41_03307 [Phyllobacterium sp. YR531]
MAMYQLVPFLLSLVICLTLPSFQAMFSTSRTATFSTARTTVAAALGISSAGLAITGLTTANGGIVILLGILLAAVTKQYAQHSSLKIAAAFLMFLLYVRYGALFPASIQPG